MATGITAQVLTEVKEIRKEVHAIDTKLEVHLSQDIEWRERIMDNYKSINQNGIGLKTRVATLEDDKQEYEEEKKDHTKFKLDIRSGIIVGAITLIMSVAAQMIVAKIF